jgi:hypothetical protein
MPRKVTQTGVAKPLIALSLFGPRSLTLQGTPRSRLQCICRHEQWVNVHYVITFADRSGRAVSGGGLRPFAWWHSVSGGKASVVCCQVEVSATG